MRVLLDTNIWVAAYSRGACYELLKHCLRRHTLVCSPPILEEYERILRRKFKIAANDVDESVRFMRKTSQIFPPAAIEAGACRDAFDLIILGTAVGGKADCIISGDKDLLTLSSFRNIPIIRPSDFWKWESNRSC